MGALRPGGMAADPGRRATRPRQVPDPVRPARPRSRIQGHRGPQPRSRQRGQGRLWLPGTARREPGQVVHPLRHRRCGRRRVRRVCAPGPGEHHQRDRVRRAVRKCPPASPGRQPAGARGLRTVHQLRHRPADGHRRQVGQRRWLLRLDHPPGHRPGRSVLPADAVGRFLPATGPPGSRPAGERPPPCQAAGRGAPWLSGPGLIRARADRAGHPRTGAPRPGIPPAGAPPAGPDRRLRPRRWRTPAR